MLFTWIKEPPPDHQTERTLLPKLDLSRRVPGAYLMFCVNCWEGENTKSKNHDLCEVCHYPMLSVAEMMKRVVELSPPFPERPVAVLHEVPLVIGRSKRARLAGVERWKDVAG